ncbi:hypothetical protein [Acinetobacter sp. AS167]|uniref:hypothetical protein n=1 Tax=Acinetobacter sp. AS167 TaxID=3127884 RepID=UPI00301A4706
MKWILSLTLIIVSTTSFAYQITDYSGKCFTQNEKKTYSCSIQKGVSAGGKFVYIEFDQKEYLIEQSTTCGGKCKPYLGTTPENVLSAKNYKKDQWSCYKQEQGNMNICYMLTK